MPGRICVFGDSNTHGTPPMTERGGSARFGADVRWPGVLRATLGHGWDVIEEGLPGRTATTRPDPEMGAAMNGLLGLEIVLRSHGALDHLVIMLGTNDLKAHFGTTPDGLVGDLAALLALARAPDMMDRHGGAQITVVCPPLVKEVGILAELFWGAEAKGADLPEKIATMAEALGVRFLDANQHIEVSPVDGVHFGASAHRTLGRAIAAHLQGDS